MLEINLDHQEKDTYAEQLAKQVHDLLQEINDTENIQIEAIVSDENISKRANINIIPHGNHYPDENELIILDITPYY